jgi:hypothetical protein
VRISKQIRSVTAKFPAQRNRELLLLEQGILNNRTGNVFARSGNRRRSTPIALASCRKTSLQAWRWRPSPSLNRWLPHASLGFLRRAASSRFWQGRWPSRSLRTAASCHAERIRRSRQFSLVRSPPVEFAIPEQTGIGRDDGSTKLKHQSAFEIESENLAVRFTPFWPKLRRSMSIGKTSKHSGGGLSATTFDAQISTFIGLG